MAALGTADHLLFVSIFPWSESLFILGIVFGVAFIAIFGVVFKLVSTQYKKVQIFFKPIKNPHGADFPSPFNRALGCFFGGVLALVISLAALLALGLFVWNELN